ncbi:hypothetical protein M378DRAFT_992105 [Amanita muscaria Koide BX008]|uniref:Uncharacterized protein n=1 Tax=Amanita muscaria (strain Koide BX008) TaxID=946122 RepID=A0A0C2SWU6_AMAMK|nr:hypothetical protein M378DRAFT_992105 [Amanita muscaria Koide BX008]
MSLWNTFSPQQNQSIFLVLPCCSIFRLVKLDNSRSPLSYAKRLAALKKREHAWRKLKSVFEATIKVNHQRQPSSVHDLTAGTYLLWDHNLRDLHYRHLPSSPQDNPRLSRILGHGPEQNWSGIIVDMGRAVYEHDLIVNVISCKI